MIYRLKLSSRARRDLEQRLPEGVAPAVWEFISGPLLQNPQRLGKPLGRGRAGQWVARRGQYRVIYKILEDEVVVFVVKLSHRNRAYD